MNVNTTLPFDQINDQIQDQHQQFHFGFAAVSSSSSSGSSRILLDSMGCYRFDDSNRHEDDQNYKGDEGLQIREKDKNNNHINKISLKMKKPKKKTQPSSSSSSETGFSSSPVRVCADCNTTKTPLWRSGPKGPKSLCNACGIRQRKARRAMEVAAAGGGVMMKEKAPVALKKKRCKGVGTVGSSSNGGEKKGSFEEFLIKVSNNLALQRVFPEDEKDAAILLMALSSGLLHV